MRCVPRLLGSICLAASSALSVAAPPQTSPAHTEAPSAARANFRTDADGPVLAPDKRPHGKDAGPQWYRLVEGQFPPEGSAHAVSGELMLVDHLERHFQIRADRNDSQDRGIWDLPLDATMLPYGAIYYHGAPAALQDIPLGTHLQGLFYQQDPNDEMPPLPLGPYNNRHTPDGDFRHCFSIEDDFSFHARRHQAWQIESVDLATMKLTATLMQEGKPVGASKLFDLLSSTRVMKGDGFADLKSLEKGQSVQLDLTWVTLYGPGRVTDVWVDGRSRQIAASQQLERHRNHIRERGLPGWVTAVDDEKEIVTITFFGGVDPSLFDDLSFVPDPSKLFKPPKEGEDVISPRGSLAVARESLMTYDPVNDRKRCKLLSVKKIRSEPGSSGIQIEVKCEMLLEGFRPHRIVRYFPISWNVLQMPQEERYSGRE